MPADEVKAHNAARYLAERDRRLAYANAYAAARRAARAPKICKQCESQVVWAPKARFCEACRDARRAASEKASGLRPARKLYEQEWRRANADKGRSRTAAWRKRNLDWDRAKQFRRRAIGDLRVADIATCAALADGVCSYCLKPHSALTVDHVLPISRLGTNDLSNLVMACSTCNSVKRARTPLEFLCGLPRLGVSP